MVAFNHITFVNCVGVVLNLRTSFSPFGIGIFGGQNSLKNQDFDSQPNSTKLLVEEAQPFEPNQTKLPCQPVGGPNSIRTKVNPVPDWRGVDGPLLGEKVNLCALIPGWLS